MEFEGIRLDPIATHELSNTLKTKIREATNSIYEEAGESFNISSPKQLGIVLFEKLQLVENPKKTKTGQYQTNEQTLSDLSKDHEIVRKVLDYRTFSKLKSTYVDTLPGYISPKSNRIHTHYDQAVTTTGRMQSHDPNLQNIPIRSDLGKEIRKAFVARNSDFLLLAADYSQIELRIAASLSQDPNMIDAFRSQQDIHSATAATLYGVSHDQVSGDMRRKAKTVNFGILYGISAFGLSQRTEMNRSEAKELIELYFKKYSKIQEWMDKTIEFAHKNEYVETITGRRRYLRDINSQNKTTANAVERNAINAPIQGTAADMIKLAMTRIQTEIQRQNLKSRMLLQVHDELVFDMHVEEEEILKTLVDSCMKIALPLDSVEIEVEMGSGKNWLQAH
jgi:DNA polymerase-1